MKKKDKEEALAEESEEAAEEEPKEEETTEEVSEEPQREMHKIKCSECGADTEVPFKPTEGRPVYCRDCFMKRRGPRKNFGRRRF